MTKTLTEWHRNLIRILDRARREAYPTHRTPCGSSTITGRTFHW